LQTLFQKLDLLGKCFDYRHVGFDRQRHIGRQRHLFDIVARQLLDLVAADPRAELAGGDVLDGEDMRGAAAHQLHALPRQIAYCA